MVGAVEDGFLMPAMTRVRVWGSMFAEDELREDKVILFSVVLNVQTGVNTVFVPVTVAHEEEEVRIVIVDGKINRILPVLEIESAKVIENV